jgi:hypothetical protein
MFWTLTDGRSTGQHIRTCSTTPCVGAPARLDLGRRHCMLGSRTPTRRHRERHIQVRVSAALARPVSTLLFSVSTAAWRGGSWRPMRGVQCRAHGGLARVRTRASYPRARGRDIFVRHKRRRPGLPG